MRILIVSNLFPPHYLGGYEILAGQVADQLGIRGHEVHVLTSIHGVDPDAAEAKPESDKLASVERSLALEVPFEQPFEMDFARRKRLTGENEERTRAAINRVQPEVIFFWSPLRLTVGPMRAGRESGLPRAFTFNDENYRSYIPTRAGDGNPKRQLRRIFDLTYMRGTTTAGRDFPNSMVISKHTRSALVKWGLPVQHARIVYQGIPIERFPAKDTPGELHHPLRALYVGQLLDYKGVGDIVEAFAGPLTKLAAPGDFTLSLAGSGPEPFVAACKERAAESPFDIRWLGKVPYDDLPQVYRDHDVLLFPSTHEAFGLTQLEAMASGTPVIATTTGGHGEMLVDRENCLVVGPHSPGDIADRLVELRDSPELAGRLATEGRRCVAERFTFARYLDDTEGLLRQAVESAEKMP